MSGNINRHILMEKLQQACAASLTVDFHRGLLEAQRIVMNLPDEDENDRPTCEWIPVKKALPDKNGFYLVTVSGYGKRPHMKFLGYDAIGKKWGEGGVVAWCNISPYEQEAEE